LNDLLDVIKAGGDNYTNQDTKNSKGDNELIFIKKTVDEIVFLNARS